MKQNQRHQQWDNWFEKLRSLPAAEPKPFFYTRVQARINNRRADSWRFRPAYAAVALLLLLLLNVFSALNYWQTETYTTESTSYDGFAAEYNLIQFNWDANE